MVNAAHPAAGLALLAAALVIWPTVQRASGAGRRHVSRIRLHRGVLLCGGAGAAAIVPAVVWAPVASLALLTATAVRLLTRARRRRRAGREADAVVQALAALIRELEIGIPPEAARARIAADQPPWLGRLLTGGSGGEIAPAWMPVAERLHVAAALSARHGIALAVVLGSMVRDLKDRSEAGVRRAAQTAGPAMSGYVLAALPAAGMALGAGMGADPIGVLVGSALGGVLLVAGVVLTCAGLLWADHIVQGRSRG